MGTRLVPYPLQITFLESFSLQLHLKQSGSILHHFDVPHQQSFVHVGIVFQLRELQQAPRREIRCAPGFLFAGLNGKISLLRLFDIQQPSGQTIALTRDVPVGPINPISQAAMTASMSALWSATLA